MIGLEDIHAMENVETNKVNKLFEDTKIITYILSYSSVNSRMRHRLRPRWYPPRLDQVGKHVGRENKPVVVVVEFSSSPCAGKAWPSGRGYQ